MFFVRSEKSQADCDGNLNQCRAAWLECGSGTAQTFWTQVEKCERVHRDPKDKEY
jgi:hypothetical protein